MPTNPVKKFLHAIIPSPIMEWRRKHNIARLRAQNLHRSTQDIFSEIYQEAVWGGQKGEFCSGSGSTTEMIRDYCGMVNHFIAGHHVTSVLDLGCGDFEVGKNIQAEGVSYIGIDIVPALIERNQREYGSDFTRFECINIIEDPLPDADLCLIRQVLQHLSNDQILAVLKKVQKYPYVIITEHYPSDKVDAVPNVDKPHGPDTRIVDNSAVYLDRSPFDLYPVRLLLSTPIAHSLVSLGESIRSYLVETGAQR